MLKRLTLVASGSGSALRLRPAALAPEVLFLAGLTAAAGFCPLGTLLPACEHMATVLRHAWERRTPSQNHKNK